MSTSSVRRNTSLPIEPVHSSIAANEGSLTSLSGRWVKIRIWTKESAQRNIVYYGHVALEVNTGGKDNRSTYISFWERSLNDTHASCCENGPHLHHAEREDELCESKRKIDNNENLSSKSHTYVLYSLDVDEIERAFNDFSCKYKTLSKLGGGLFKTSYPMTNAGLAAYLLDMGGIDKLYAKGSQISNTLKVCIGIGVVFAAYTFYSARQLRLIGTHTPNEFDINDALWNEINSIYVNKQWLVFHLKSSSKIINTTKDTLEKIRQAAISVSTKLQGIESAKAIRNDALNIINKAEKIHFPPMFRLPSFSKREDLTPSQVAITASNMISAITREILYSVAAISIFYLCKRYFREGVNTSRDIAVISRKSEKTEGREIFKRLDQQYSK